MDKSKNENQRYVFGTEWTRVFLYSSLLFLFALLGLWYFRDQAQPTSPAILASFLIYTFFTVVAGYRHPYFGYISMDRAGQLLCLFTLGSFHAAWISGFSYFLFSWLRLRRGVPLKNTINAVLVNTGMMTLMLLIAGTFYQWLGGIFPLEAVSVHNLLLVLLTLLVMQVFNDLAMLTLVFLRGGNPKKTLVLGATLIEMGTGFVGMTLAFVYNKHDLPLFLLVLAVISIGMLVMKQYANIRIHLEALVSERTQRLQDQAHRDPLTRLSNRRCTDLFIADQIEHARLSGSVFCIALLDIDHFKRINDRYFHATGDKVLQRLSQLLEKNCRATDLAGRYGGEEFIICFPTQLLDASIAASEKIRQLVEKENWDDIAPGMKVTVSLGVTQWQPGMNAAALVAAADEKLYKAKTSGRNQVCH